MFWFLIILIPLLIAVWPTILYFTRVGKNREDPALGITVLSVISIILSIICLIHTLVNYSFQIRDGEELVKIEKFEEIYQKKSDILTTKFSYYLANVYPEYEKNIFESISPEVIDIYLVKYPELKASETIMLLVSEIRMLQNDYYNQQLERAEVIRIMSYRKKSPWVIQWFMPNVEM